MFKEQSEPWTQEEDRTPEKLKPDPSVIVQHLVVVFLYAQGFKKIYICEKKTIEKDFYVTFWTSNEPPLTKNNPHNTM